MASWLLAVPLVVAAVRGSEPERQPAKRADARTAALPACTIIGSGASETLVGTAGDDVICALGGDDVVRGRGGDDVLFGSFGDDVLEGGPGRDRLNGHWGRDALRGGGGRDRLHGGGDPDVFSGGAGPDLVDYGSRLRPVEVSIGRRANDGSPGELDSVRGDVERVRGGAGDDRLVGNARANRLHGGGGDDTLVGRKGNDRMWGGAGVDRVDGRDGGPFEDGLRCGAGRPDVALANAADRVAADCENGRRGTPPTPEAPAGSNWPPTNITLSNAGVAENRPAGTLVGTLDAIDRDAGDTHRFALISGGGSDDNASFAIDGDQLKTAAVFDFEGKSRYSIRVRVRDERGAAFQQALTITIVDVAESVNHAPTDVALAPALVAENLPAGSAVGTLAATDSDPGDPHAFALVAGDGDADNGAFTMAGDQLRTAQTFDFESRSSYSIRVATTDAAGATFAKALAVTIGDANEPPTALALSYTTIPENEPSGTTVGDLSVTDVDAGQSHAFTLVTGAGDTDNGKFAITGSTLKTAQPLDFETSPTYSIRVRATDSGTPPISVERDLTITLTDTQEPPAAVGKSVATDEDAPVTVTLSATDPESDDVTAFTTDAPTHGMVGPVGPITCAGTPKVCSATVTFTPEGDHNGAAGFSYTASDGARDSLPATVSITVGPVNDAPQASAGTVSVAEDGSAPVDLAALVSDVETSDANLAYTIVSPPSHGGLTGSGGSRTYAPDGDFNGADSFTYAVTDRGDPDGCTASPCDGPETSSTRTVSLTVDPLNDAPTADPKTVSGMAEEAAQAFGLSGADVDGDALTFTVVSGPQHGALDTTTPAAACDGATPSGCTASVTYTPAVNFSGSDSFTYTVDDGTLDSAPATVSVTVDPVNDQPVATPGSASADEDGSAPIDLAALVSDVETADAVLTYEIVTVPADGDLSGAGGSRTYTPDANFNGSDSFTYRVTDRGDPDNCSGAACDGPETSSTETVSITVDPANDAPVATPASVSGDEDGSVPIDLAALVSDIETADADLSYTIVSPPAHGALAGGTYTPDADFYGPDSFTYEVTDRGDPDNCSSAPCDGPTVSTIETVSITVDAVNDAPVNSLPAGPVTAVQDTDTPLSGISIADVDAGDDDLEVTLSVERGPRTVDPGVPLGLTMLQVAGNGTGDVAILASLAELNTTLAAAGGLVYHGDAPYTGPDELTVATSDAGHNGSGGPQTDTDTLAIVVQPPNLPPVADAQSVSTDEDAAKTITLSASDSDGDVLTLGKGADPTHGSLGALGTVSCTGATPNVCTADIVYTPAADYFGPDSFTFTAADSLATSSPATVSITVDEVNDAPQLADIESGALAYTENDLAKLVTETTTVSDIDSANFDTGTLTVDHQAGSGTADDRLEIADQGNGAGQIGVSGTTVSFAGTPIGTFAGGSGAAPLVVTLNASATVSATQALVRAVTFRNVSDAPATGPRTARFVLTDGDGGTSNAATRAITVSAVNDVAVLANIEPGALAFTENSPVTPVTTALTVADLDSDITGATVTISENFAGAAQDILSFTPQNGITGDYAGGVLTLSGTASAADYQTALRSVTYHNASEDPTTNTREVTFQVQDGPAAANLSNTQSRDITVTAVNDAPVADDETFSGGNGAIGNTSLVVNDPDDGAPALSSPKKSISGDILAGDTDVDDGSPVVQPVTDQPTNDGGRVTIEADGDFTYVNDPADACADTSDFFTYTVSDQNATGPGPTPGTDTGQVNISIAGCVWYVSNNASGNSGTSDAPFDTVDQSEAASGINHTVFVFDGSGAAYTATGGYAMNAGERLIGEHEGLVVDPDGGGSLGSETLHAANAGARPTLTATGADVVELDDGTEVRGFDIDPQGTGGGIAGATGDTGGGTIDDVNIADAGTAGTQPGLELDSTTGTFNVSNLVVSTNGATGVRLHNTTTPANAVSAVFSPASQISITAAGAPALNVTGTVAAPVALGTSTFDDITVTGSSTGGVNLTNTTGTINLGDGTGSDLSLTTTSGATPAFALDNAGAITVPAGGTVNVSATGGPAVDVTGTSGAALPFDAVSSINSAGDGINLAGLGAGTFSADSGSIGGAAGIAFDLDGGSGTVTFPGTITNGQGSIAEISGRTGGAVTLSGPITETGDADATQENGGIALTGNTGGSTIINNATKTFSTGEDHAIVMGTSDGHTLTLSGGSLDVDTTSGKGLEATTSGTLNVTGSLNTIDTTTGNALNVTDTDVGATPLTFQRIAANGATSGIQLSNTGANSALTVTSTGAGTCTNADTSGCSGGSIGNTTGADNSGATPGGTAIVLNNTRGISLSRMRLHNNSNYGLRGTGVVGFTLANSVINGTNGTDFTFLPDKEGSLRFAELTGTVSVTDTFISGGANNNVLIQNTSGTLNSTFTNLTSGALNNSSAEDAMMVEGTSTATTNATVQSSTFTNAPADIFLYIGDGSGGGALNFTGNTVTNNHPAIVTGGGGVTLAGGANGATTMNIANNTMRDSHAAGLDVNKSSGTGSLTATINNNDIGVTGVANSGSLQGNGLDVRSGQGNANYTVTNNEIRQYNSHGMAFFVGTGTAGQTGTVNVNLSGNTIQEPGNNPNITLFQGVRVESGISSTDTFQTCVNIGAGNVITGSSDAPNKDWRLLGAGSTTVRLPGYAGGAQDDTAATTFINGRFGSGANGVASSDGSSAWSGSGTSCP